MPVSHLLLCLESSDVHSVALAVSLAICLVKLQKCRNVTKEWKRRIKWQTKWSNSIWGKKITVAEIGQVEITLGNYILKITHPNGNRSQNLVSFIVRAQVII